MQVFTFTFYHLLCVTGHLSDRSFGKRTECKKPLKELKMLIGFGTGFSNKACTRLLPTLLKPNSNLRATFKSSQTYTQTK